MTAIHPRLSATGSRPLHRLLLGALLTLPAMLGTAADLIPIDAVQQAAFGIVSSAPIPATETLTRRYPAEVTVPNPQMRVVATPQSGVIEALLVAEGEQVSVGQVLAELRSPELVDAQSQYLEALTRLALSERELARDQMLHREGVIAERRLLESQSRQRELATVADQRRQLLELAGLTTEEIETLAGSRRLTPRLQLRAPIAGVVLEQLVNTGQAIASATPLYRIARLDPLWLEIHVPVDRLAGLGEGARVLLPREGMEGVIVTVGRMTHGQDQGVLVRAEVREGAERLRPGQFVEVQLSATAAGEAWRIPLAALVRHASESYLFLVRDGGFTAQPVKVLAEEETDAVVTGELSGTDQIAISGVVALKAAWLGGAE